MTVTEKELLFAPLDIRYLDDAKKILLTDPISANYHLRALDEECKNLISVVSGDQLAALLLVNDPAPTSFLSVFVSPEFRHRGIGKASVKYGEELLRRGDTKIVGSYFCAQSLNSRRFARSLGYEKYFESIKMERRKEPFDTEPLSVRSYRDEDYLSAQGLYARAFHEMRVRVGCFPDSVIAQPSEADRRQWLDTEGGSRRYIYEENDEIVAYAHLCKNEIESISVRFECQGRGIGRKFLRYLCNEIYARGYDTVILWCVVGNFAKNLYSGLGFTESFTAEFSRKKL